MAFPMKVGSEIKLHGALWTCVIPCTVVGVTLDDHQPVLKGPIEPRLNNGDLRLSSEVADQGKPGQVPIEVSRLRMYKQIGPYDTEEIKGKTIIYWKLDTLGGITIIFQGGDYLKLDLTSGYDGPELSSEELDMSDLRALGCLPPGVWEIFLAEKEKLREGQRHSYGESQLSEAIDELGIDRVRELVSKTTPEN
jgi:hypothetical protein